MRGLSSVRALLPFRPRSEHGESVGLRGGPRIAVIGNCQARGVAQAMRVLAPASRIDHLPAARLRKDHRSLRSLDASLDGYDRVFAQPFDRGFFPDGDSRDLVAKRPGMGIFPPIVFTAFHPDAVYVGDMRSQASPRIVRSPLGDYHSAITLFGFLRGLDPARIVRLFRREVFEALGYLDMWGPAARELTQHSASIGFDLGADLVRWSRTGAFMHVINHPKLVVLGDVAARLLRESGISPAEIPLDAYLADDLVRQAIWPVHAPIAERYGVKASSLFKLPGKHDEPPRLLDLDGFVTLSVALYRTLPRESLTHHRVTDWAARPEIRAIFDAA